MQLSPLSIQQAKELVLQRTNRRITEQDARRGILNSLSNLELSSSDESRAFWRSRIEQYNSWLNSEEFRLGNYPEGIDELVLTLIEIRAYVDSFERCFLNSDIFAQYRFFELWLSSAAYAATSKIGKLVSTDTRDNSLRTLWPLVAPHVQEDRLCSLEEANYISSVLSPKHRRFSNLGSRAILARNKMVAHNESNPRVGWHDLDEDIWLIVRIWSLLVRFCSFGLTTPFFDQERAFAGIDRILNLAEVSALKAARADYLKRVDAACRTDCATGKLLDEPGPFAFFSVERTFHVAPAPNSAEA